MGKRIGRYREFTNMATPQLIAEANAHRKSITVSTNHALTAQLAFGQQATYPNSFQLSGQTPFTFDEHNVGSLITSEIWATASATGSTMAVIETFEYPD